MFKVLFLVICILCQLRSRWCVSSPRLEHRAVWHSGNPLKLHSDGTGYKSLSGHQLSLLKSYMVFLIPSRRISA
jgi:hypothetical protein